MADNPWQEPPSIPLLQWLARGALKQNLLQAVRLWVWLRLLYGSDDERLPLPTPFTYAQWRDTFFSATHPTTEAKPDPHAPRCPCTKTTAAWLFHPELAITEAQWQIYQPQAAAQIAQFRQSLADHGQLPPQFDSLLNTRLFGVTRRTLASDLRRLTDIHWLDCSGAAFSPVDLWPDYPRQATPTTWATSQEVSALTQPDLAAIAENLSSALSGHRRFFVHVDYVVAKQNLDQVDDWQALLADLWQQQPVPPVALSYQGARATHPETITVYPVCIYYYRRGPYLCGYGQIPGQPPDATGWRNYRLDRIHAITPHPWDGPTIPPSLRQQYQAHTLPTPDAIAAAMEDAWGFDYYQPSQLLLLRFDPDWNRRYIRDTLRHSTFRVVPYAQVDPLIQQQVRGPTQAKLLALWRKRSPDDAYYQAQYRQNDPNVRQRLRAWRPHVEILLPWELRQQTIQDISQEMTLYDL
ncbi:TIGR03985 family CRISPR-associated protein [Nodosilinea nodulosa]|uniref:TIGR03985 family CRISPR-associated protein n=1 Tax=Nodosilinea nodulosa TaxID=416001 RepID=UPI000474D7E5|nr:TIGR03985 family CRISPR-associated protein [Nodosilinea nodulosa]